MDHAKSGSGTLPSANIVCEVCGSSSGSQHVCLKCGSRRRGVQRDPSLRVFGVEPRRPSVAITTDLLGVPPVPRGHSPRVRAPLSRDATMVKLKEAVVSSPEALQQTVVALLERMQDIEAQMQEEIRQRYKLENLVMRCTEDLLRLKGVKLTNEVGLKSFFCAISCSRVAVGDSRLCAPPHVLS